MADLEFTPELIAQLEQLAVRTDKGSYIAIDDLKKLVERKKAEVAEEEERPQRMTVEQARHGARKWLREQQEIERKPAVGRAIPAAEPQSSSRTLSGGQE